MPKAIIFDIGGVIANDVEEPLFRRIAKEQKISFKSIWKARKRNWELASTGRMSENTYWKNMLSQTKIKGGIALMKKRARQQMAATKGIIGLIRKLCMKYTLAIISDNSKEWAGYVVAKYNLKRYFKVITTSDRAGIRKPHPRIYRVTLKKLGLKPEECVFIDNHGFNLAPARKMGMKTILFRNTKQLEAKLRK